MDSSSFSARLNTYYEREFGYKPHRVTVKEDDPTDDGIHYHAAMIIDGKLNTVLSINYFFAELQKKGFLVDYNVITPDSDPHGLQLNDELGRDQFFYWLSYIAKVRTKTLGKQCVSMCKAVQFDLQDWKKNGKGNLGQPHITQNSKTLYNAPWAILGANPLQTIGYHPKTAQIDV